MTALVIPSLEELRFYTSYKKLPLERPEELIGSPEIRSLMVRRISERIKDLSKAEQIQYIKLLPEEFTLEKGELTPTLKVRRRIIAKKYKKEIDMLYDEKSDRIAVTF